MIKTICLCMFASFGYAQMDSEIEAAQIVKADSSSVSQDIGLLGYQFHQGQLAVIPISEGLYLQTGILQSQSNEFHLVEFPILFKKKVAKNFYAFFGAKLNMVNNPGILSIQPSQSLRDYGASAEIGLQYDVSEKMMLELRYSVPILKNQGVYPSVPSIQTTPMLRLGTGFKF